MVGQLHTESCSPVKRNSIVGRTYMRNSLSRSYKKMGGADAGAVQNYRCRGACRLLAVSMTFRVSSGHRFILSLSIRNPSAWRSVGYQALKLPGFRSAVALRSFSRQNRIGDVGLSLKSVEFTQAGDPVSLKRFGMRAHLPRMRGGGVPCNRLPFQYTAVQA